MFKLWDMMALALEIRSLNQPTRHQILSAVSYCVSPVFEFAMVVRLRVKYIPSYST